MKTTFGYGMTGSVSAIGMTGSFGQIGITGHRGQPGQPGINKEDFEEKTFYCKKDYGFIKEGTYFRANHYHSWLGTHHIKSLDNKTQLNISDKEMIEHFTFGAELRDKTIGDILNSESI